MYLSKKKVDTSLSFKQAVTSVYGIGKTRFSLLSQMIGHPGNILLDDLSFAGQERLSQLIDRYTTAGVLKKIEIAVLTQHFRYGSYKGIRMQQGMPCRGQRTHTNASTSRRAIRMPTLINQAYRGSFKRKA